MNVEVIAPCINYYTDVYDASVLIDMIEEESQQSWPRLEWERSRTGTGQISVVNEYRSSLSMNLSSIMVDTELVEMNDVRNEFINVWRKIDECIHDYRNSYDLYLTQHEQMSVLKYEDGAEYKAHWDAGGPNDNLRTLSMIAYFNDDYVGGELQFTNFDTKIKPSAGSVVLFPSSYPYKHIAYPVTSGIKYALVTWFS